MSFFSKLFSKDKSDQDSKIEPAMNIDGIQIINEPPIAITEVPPNKIEPSLLIDYIIESGYPENEIKINLDPLLKEAAYVIVEHQHGSTSLIQRKLKLGYNRAGRIIDQLEKLHIVSEFKGDIPRQVFVKSINELDSYFKLLGYNQNELMNFYLEHKVEIESKKAELSRTTDEILKEKIKQKILAQEKNKKLHQEALKELIEEGQIFNEYTNNQGKRESIPQDVMNKVWNRDGGKCVMCGSNEDLEFDHIIPFSKGGSSTYRNLQLLCKKCNLQKSNRIG